MRNALAGLFWIALEHSRKAAAFVAPAPKAVPPSSVCGIRSRSSTSSVVLHAVSRTERYGRTIINRNNRNYDDYDDGDYPPRSYRRDNGRYYDDDDRRSFGRRYGRGGSGPQLDDVAGRRMENYKRQRYGRRNDERGRRSGGYNDDGYYTPYNYRNPLFGNSEYYYRQGSSESFRTTDSGARYRPESERKQDRLYSQSSGARYGWQQQYDPARGNVRSGSSSESFRRGTAFDRIQDMLTPGQRERRQQLQNSGARYGYQQQYDAGRGNVRRGSSSDFRRGREKTWTRYRDYMTPRERERLQIVQNRAFGRRGPGSYYDCAGDYSYGRGAGREARNYSGGNVDEEYYPDGDGYYPERNGYRYGYDGGRDRYDY